MITSDEVGEPIREAGLRCSSCHQELSPADAVRVRNRWHLIDRTSCARCAEARRDVRRARPRDLPLAVLAGLVATGLGTWLWVLLHKGAVFGSGWIALPVSIGIAVAVIAGAGGRRGAMLQVVAVIMVAFAMLASQNFAQREDLQDGIDELQQRWPDLSVAPLPATPTAGEGGSAAPTTVAAPTPAAAQPRPTLAGGAPAPTAPPGALVPPPEIARVLPIEALLTISPEVLAVVWESIPDDRKAQLPPETVSAVEELLAGPPPDTAPAEPASTVAGATTTVDELAAARDRIAAARAEFDETTPDVPKPVLVCAPPPDFTQPDAAAGLGFPDGLPLVLPLSDYYQERVRGDGQTYPAPTPWCFARESVKDQPVQALFWALGLLAALVVPARTKVLRDERRPTAELSAREA